MRKVYILMLSLTMLCVGSATLHAQPTCNIVDNATSTVAPKHHSDKKTRKKKVEKGEASYYADKFEGCTTASGEIYSGKKMTAAHRTLEFGTIVRVTNLANGKSVEVRINDRGPFKKGRIIDVSKAAAKKLDMLTAGVIQCTVEVIKTP